MHSISSSAASWLLFGVIVGQATTGQSQAIENTALFTQVAAIKSIAPTRSGNGGEYTSRSGASLIQLNDNKDVAAVAMYGCRTVFWDLKRNVAIGGPTKQAGDAGAIGFIANSNLAYIADWNNLHLWKQKTALIDAEGFPHRLREDSVMGPAVSPDGKVLVTRPEMNSLRFWNLETRKSIGPEHVHQGMVSMLQFSADNKWGFSRAGSLSVWDPKTGEQVAGPIRNDIYTTAYLPERQHLVTFTHDNKDPFSKSKVEIRSGTSHWATVRQFDLPGQARDAEWIDPDRLLVLATELGKKYNTVAFVVHLAQDTATFDVLFRTDDRIHDFTLSEDRHHLVTISTEKVSCWKMGVTKPKWESRWSGKYWQKHVFGTNPHWVLAHGRGDDAIAYSIEDGSELWRKKKCYPCEDGWRLSSGGRQRRSRDLVLVS